MLNAFAQPFQPLSSPKGSFDIFQLKVVHEAVYAKEVAIAHDKTDKSKQYFLKRMGKSCLLKADADWDRNDAERSLLNGTLTCCHLASYFGCHSDGLDYYVVSEYFEEGTLEDYIESDKLISHHINENLMLQWSIELIKGLLFLHTENIIHKNIKPSNIYIRNKSIRIGDISFDFSVSNRNLRSLLSSASYTSPEVLDAIMKTKSSSVKSATKDNFALMFSFKSDIWALGCVLYELVTYSTAFEDLLSVHEFTKYNRHETVRSISKLDWNAVLERMLVKDQQSRASTFEVLVKIEALNKKKTSCIYADFFEKNLATLNGQQNDSTLTLDSTKKFETSQIDTNNNFIPEHPITSTFNDEDLEEDFKMGLFKMNRFNIQIGANEAEENLVQAYELVYEGNYWFEMGAAEKAIEHYDSALNLDQFNFKAMISKSRALERLEKTDLAWQLLDQVLTIDKLHMDALITKGFLSLKAQKYEQGLECFSTILDKLDSKCLVALNGKAEAFYCMLKYKESILMFSKALSVSNEDITALLGIANVLYKVGRFRESFDYYSKIIQIDDRNRDFVLVRMGYLLIETSQHAEAIKYFDQAIAKNPNNHNAFIGKTYAQRLLCKAPRECPSTPNYSPFQFGQNNLGIYQVPAPRPCELVPFDFTV